MATPVSDRWLRMWGDVVKRWTWVLYFVVLSVLLVLCIIRLAVLSLP